MIQEYQEAPGFTLPLVVDTGTLLVESVHLATLRNRSVLLTFLPVQDLIGNSHLMKDFCALAPTLKQWGITFLAISSQSCRHIHRFVVHHQIPFPILADTDGTVAHLYGVYQPRRFFGQRYRGIIRTTILIDPSGIIRRIWSPVNPRGHTQQVVATIELLSLATGQREQEHP